MTNQNPKILLVEDEDFMIMVFTKELVKAGFINLKVVTNGNDVVGEFKKYQPDLIVLDILLPGKTGIDALKEIRELPEGKNVPVIVFSNFDNPEYKERAKELNVRDYLVKSNTLVSELVKKIKAISAT